MSRLFVVAALASLLLLAATPAPPAHGAERAPRFRDYPVRVDQAQRPPLRLSKQDRLFRTTLRQLYAQPINFAGHYVVGLIGCGAGCASMQVIDARSGRPAELGIPSGEAVADCWMLKPEVPVGRDWSYRADSRLMVVTSALPDDTCGARYYEERGGRVRLIRTVRMVTP